MGSNKLFKESDSPVAVLKATRLVVSKLAKCAAPRATTALRYIETAMKSVGATAEPDKVAAGDLVSSWSMPDAVKSIRTWHQAYSCMRSDYAHCVIKVVVERLTQVYPNSTLVHYWHVGMMVCTEDGETVMLEKDGVMDRLDLCIEKVTAMLGSELGMRKDKEDDDDI